MTPPHAWLEQQVEALGARFSRQLVAHWRETYCVTPALTLEVLGDDAARVPALFSSP